MEIVFFLMDKTKQVARGSKFATVFHSRSIKKPESFAEPPALAAANLLIHGLLRSCICIAFETESALSAPSLHTLVVVVMYSYIH